MTVQLITEYVTVEWEASFSEALRVDLDAMGVGCPTLMHGNYLYVYATPRSVREVVQ